MKNILPYRLMTGPMWDETLLSREVCTEPTGAPPNAATACMERDVRAGLQSAGQAHNILTDNSLSIASLPFCDHLSCICTELANEEPGHMQLLNNYYPVRVCICGQKNWLFSALPLENLLLSVMSCLFFDFKHLQCGLLRPASCTDRVIHAFPNKMRTSPWPRNIFF